MIKLKTFFKVYLSKCRVDGPRILDEWGAVVGARIRALSLLPRRAELEEAIVYILYPFGFVFIFIYVEPKREYVLGW